MSTVICEIQSVNEKVRSMWDIFYDTFPKFTLRLVISFHYIYVSMYYKGKFSSCMKKNKIYTTQYSDLHGYNTIHKRDLYAQFRNTERSKRGVIKMGTKILNGLPVELKN
jgi:hypothetical protein